MNKMILGSKISVIIPVYNVEDYIARCLDSCIEQTLYDIEIICVDDGSTDSTPAILDEYAQRDFRVRVFHRKNSGVSASRNFGIANSTGRWIMFVDSDDYLDKHACEIVWRETMTNSCEIICHGGFLIPDYPKPESWKYWAVITRREYYPEFSFTVMEERGSNPFLWLQAFSRELLERTGVRFIEGISFGEDLIFQFEIFPYARGVSFIPERFYFYRWYRNGSLMKEAARDLDQRTSMHISNAGLIAGYWREHGLLDKYGKNILGWMLSLVIPDLETLELKNVNNLAIQLQKTIEKNGIKDYYRQLDGVGRRQYRKMQSLASAGK